MQLYRSSTGSTVSVRRQNTSFSALIISYPTKFTFLPITLTLALDGGPLREINNTAPGSAEQDQTAGKRLVRKGRKTVCITAHMHM